jgi:hypothetical protein
MNHGRDQPKEVEPANVVTPVRIGELRFFGLAPLLDHGQRLCEAVPAEGLEPPTP